MPLSKKEEVEVLKVYDTWLDSYLNGDVETYDYYLDDRYHFIGSTDNEEFLSREDTTKFFRKTADQLDGKTRIRNKRRIVEKFGQLIFITELFDADFLYVDKWAYYGKFRFTSAMQKKREGWRFIYQHFSMPDSKAQEGESLSTEQIAAENLMLREAVQRRTIELEHKSRELEMEASLERVRAVAMSMIRQADLAKIGEIIFKELKALGFTDLRNTEIVINNDKKEYITSYYYSDYGVTGVIELDFESNPVVKDWAEKIKITDDALPEIVISEKELDAWRKYREEIGYLPDPKLDEAKAVFYHSYSTGLGALSISSFKAVTGEQMNILKRFRNVFRLAYKRYVEIAVAEEQALQDRIEASLERVRAKAMAMHGSTDLSETVNVFFRELKTLGVNPIRCGVAEVDSSSHSWTLAVTNATKQGDSFEFLGAFRKLGHPFLEEMYAHWESQEEYFPVLQGKDLKNYYQVLKPQIDIPDFGEDNAHYGNYFYFREGFVFAWMERELADEELGIFRRFTSVLSLTYRRYLDLKEAEAQAKEAQIEAALERVRARSMAMHKTEELNEVISLVLSQIRLLGLVADGAMIYIHDESDSDLHLWLQDTANTFAQIVRFPMIEHSFCSSFPKAINNGSGIYPVLFSKEDTISLFNYFFEHSDLKKIPQKRKKYVYQGKGYARSIASAGKIALAVDNFQAVPYAKEENDVLMRLARVFKQTYIRFQDLQKAEKQAYQARIETALERVRSRALAMQQPEELKEVAQLLRYEMGKLEIEELETCSIYIVAGSLKNVECWYALKDIRKDGKKLVNDHFILDLKDTWVGMEMKKFYKSNEERISIVMKGEARVEWIRYCEEHSTPFQGFYGDEIPDRTYHLYRFSQGYMGFASAGEISSESWDILKRSASAFTLAYSRFQDLTKAREDLIKLKEEKQRAETALSELKSTQTQLIHAEKMASLGELTAGIAHEIQNPLNFVNNFSELNDELLEELKQEIEKGNRKDALELIADLMSNEEKITHHGKRAEGIVRSMLQHSRGSTGKKEKVDINALCDEYLRLAYHGMRARDKSFNAEFETYFDHNLPKVYVTPQEIGRVFINLINNAFQACGMPQPQPGAAAPGMVSIKTQLINNASGHRSFLPDEATAKAGGPYVQITISDNGPGIPENIRDKIFQPFFTTKPTGQGTGLGLSLAFDIVTKGHGGKLEVETEEGVGTSFIVELPKG